MEIRKGDLYYADLAPVIGSEQGGIRPVLIVQNDVGNYYSPTVIAAAITSRAKKHLPTHIRLNGCFGSLHPGSTVMLEQLRTLDRFRLKNYIGQLDKTTMRDVDKALIISLDLKDEISGEKADGERKIRKEGNFSGTPKNSPAHGSAERV